MHRVLVFAALAIGFSLAVPSLLSERSDEEKSVDLAAAERTPATSRTVRLDADRSGHFTAEFKINGRKVDGLIDTGATAVAINDTMARKLGVKLKPADFTHRVQTANGSVAVAPVLLKRIELGSIRVRDVRAVVIGDDSLAHTLIGMSFLKRLRSYRVENNTLILSL
ncbi:TIGR02281 family clan AA aspartic protease [Hoeflea sp. WL0058]|uniref:TIGR02281 family clan AA aspartic protease n=2 Tax=Flavimaribacter sediminis TaxID=2865987 RepID=A0AAE2ZP23_9HYPH|nr:TIGR02281 family clan AA aspartic protease [Flavimaribacter sediminis]